MALSSSPSSPSLSTFSSPPSNSLSSHPPVLKVPAKSPGALHSAPKSHERALRVQAPSLTHSPAWDRSWVSSRRGLMSTAILPFLLQMRDFTEDSFPANAEELNSNYDMIMKEEIRKVVSKGKAAGMLRLAFHDAGTFEMDGNSEMTAALYLKLYHEVVEEPGFKFLGGMNGSIIYELDRPENAGLKKSLKVLEKAKTEVDSKQQGKKKLENFLVSWADMIAVAGAEAVSICGGPTINIMLGRLDSLGADPPGRLPQESLDASALKQCFQKKGFSTQELVVLSGAHTLGSKGFGNPNVFDNSYYRILLEKPWSSAAGMSSMIGLPSDRALVEDNDCIRWIEAYANNQNLFFKDFKDAYTKLVNFGARWRSL